MTDTLELVETEKVIVPKSPILHAICLVCDAHSDELRAFCGTLRRGGSRPLDNPPPPDKCAMCVEIKASLPAGTCPKGHNVRGLT